MPSKITVTFTKRAIGSPPGDDGYFVRTKVETSTTPDELETPFVITKASFPTAEQYTRVATLSDLATLSVDVPPVNLIRSTSFLGAVGTFLAGDVITIMSPLSPVWREMGVSAGKTYTVNSVVGVDGIVGENFLAYAQNIKFTVTRGTAVYGPYSDGQADRDYTGFVGTEFLVGDYSFFDTSKTSIVTLVNTMRDDLQTLADSYDLNQFESDEWVLYTGTMGTQLRLRYITKAMGSPAGTDGYYFHVEVDTATTETDLHDSIVFRRALEDTREQLVRVATLSDLDNVVTSVPALTKFLSAYLLELPGGSATTGDTLTIDTTPLWEEMGVVPPTVTNTVSSSVGDEAVVSSGFTAYEGALTYTVTRGISVYGPYDDGVAARNITGDDELYYRVDTYDTVVSDFNEAQSLLAAMKTQAQSLVDAFDADNFSSVSTETFE